MSMINSPFSAKHFLSFSSIWIVSVTTHFSTSSYFCWSSIIVSTAVSIIPCSCPVSTARLPVSNWAIFWPQLSHLISRSWALSLLTKKWSRQNRQRTGLRTLTRNIAGRLMLLNWKKVPHSIHETSGNMTMDTRTNDGCGNNDIK